MSMVIERERFWEGPVRGMIANSEGATYDGLGEHPHH